MACFAHSELHPYIASSIYLSMAPHVGDTVTQWHSVGGPIYEQYYSRTYGWNKTMGVAGDVVDDSLVDPWVKDMTISPPPHWASCTTSANAVSVQTYKWSSAQNASDTSFLSWTSGSTINLHMSGSGGGATVYDTNMLMARLDVSTTGCPATCTPKTATAACVAQSCGFASDGCTSNVSCGVCATGYKCDGSSCQPQVCDPAACECGCNGAATACMPVCTTSQINACSRQNLACACGVCQ